MNFIERNIGFAALAALLLGASAAGRDERALAHVAARTPFEVGADDVLVAATFATDLEGFSHEEARRPQYGRNGYVRLDTHDGAQGVVQLGGVPLVVDDPREKQHQVARRFKRPSQADHFTMFVRFQTTGGAGWAWREPDMKQITRVNLGYLSEDRVEFSYMEPRARPLLPLSFRTAGWNELVIHIDRTAGTAKFHLKDPSSGRWETDGNWHPFNPERKAVTWAVVEFDNEARGGVLYLDSILIAEGLHSPVPSPGPRLEKQAAQMGETFRPVTLSFEGGEHANPYTDVDFWADMIGPDRQVRRAYGYWDGGQTWRVRFAPNHAGTWTYLTGASGDDSLAGKRGTIYVRKGRGPGFVEIDPASPFTFRRTNGASHFPMGDTCWNGMSTQGGRMTFDIFNQLVAKRRTQNFNFLRIYIYPFYSGGETTPANANEGGPAFHGWSPGRLNPAFFREVDRRMESANGQGMVMHLLFGGDRQNLTKFFGNDEDLERWIRYCCARYGAYDICWEGRAEFEEQGPDAAALANKMGRWVQRYDVHRHLQSMHTSNSNNELGNESWLSWIMHQSRDWSLITEDRSYGKPVINEEFYYENSGAGKTHPHHVDAATLRKGAWNVMTAGASGLAYANTGTYNSHSKPFVGLEHVESEGAVFMKYLYAFWSTRAYGQMVPRGESVTAHPGQEYVAYLEQAGERKLELPPGEYRWRWFNPRDGSHGADEIVSGGSRKFTTPDANDWVLEVRRVGS